MKAVVFHEFGRSDVLRVEELPDPAVGPGEVLVDITATALNHLDVDVREGTSRFPVELPHTLGVELAGEIEELGEGVEGWSRGDRVNPYIMETCGECRYCATGRENLCLTPGFISFSTGGGYAERVVVKARNLIRSRRASPTRTQPRSRSPSPPPGTCCSRGAICGPARR